MFSTPFLKELISVGLKPVIPVILAVSTLSCANPDNNVPPTISIAAAGTPTPDLRRIPETDVIVFRKKASPLSVRIVQNGPSEGIRTESFVKSEEFMRLARVCFDEKVSELIIDYPENLSAQRFYEVSKNDTTYLIAIADSKRLKSNYQLSEKNEHLAELLQNFYLIGALIESCNTSPSSYSYSDFVKSIGIDLKLRNMNTGEEVELESVDIYGFMSIFKAKQNDENIQAVIHGRISLFFWYELLDHFRSIYDPQNELKDIYKGSPFPTISRFFKTIGVDPIEAFEKFYITSDLEGYLKYIENQAYITLLFANNQWPKRERKDLAQLRKTAQEIRKIFLKAFFDKYESPEPVFQREIEKVKPHFNQQSPPQNYQFDHSLPINLTSNRPPSPKRNGQMWH